jgi:hypothetical protein
MNSHLLCPAKQSADAYAKPSNTNIGNTCNTPIKKLTNWVFNASYIVFITFYEYLIQAFENFNNLICQHQLKFKSHLLAKQF